jgi:hypothetical protein
MDEAGRLPTTNMLSSMAYFEYCAQVRHGPVYLAGIHHATCFRSFLNDPSFGATTIKLIEVGGIYWECRRAALADGKRRELNVVGGIGFDTILSPTPWNLA